MTTIAFDGKTLAADSLVSLGGNFAGYASKIRVEKHALGAMAAGATAEEAVKLAGYFDEGTGGEVVAVRLPWLEPETGDLLAALGGAV